MAKTIEQHNYHGIDATVIADSKNPQGDRITTMVVTFPRIVLAEFNTHRMFSRNSASSRAIPFKKMVETVQEHPFIPVAWQKDHKGMQGTEYLDQDKLYSIEDFMVKIRELLGDNHEHWQTPVFEYLQNVSDLRMSLKNWWLFARDRAMETAIFLNCFGVSKQICNRLLEPFMWHTVILTTSEEGLENFFKQRCPNYEQMTSYNLFNHRSRKDYLRQVGLPDTPEHYENWTDLEWLQINKYGYAM